MKMAFSFGVGKCTILPSVLGYSSYFFRNILRLIWDEIYVAVPLAQHIILIIECPNRKDCLENNKKLLYFRITPRFKFLDP